MCWSVSQHVAVCCSMLQYVAVCCSVLQCVAVCCSVLQCVANIAGRRRVLQGSGAGSPSHCSTVQHTETLQCTATHCNALRRTATLCNTLRNSRGLAKDAHRSDPISEYDQPYHLNITNSNIQSGNGGASPKIVQSTATLRNTVTLQHTLTLQHTVTHGNVLQCTAIHHRGGDGGASFVSCMLFSENKPSN